MEERLGGDGDFAWRGVFSLLLKRCGEALSRDFQNECRGESAGEASKGLESRVDVKDGFLTRLWLKLGELRLTPMGLISLNGRGMAEPLIFSGEPLLIRSGCTPSEAISGLVKAIVLDRSGCGMRVYQRCLECASANAKSELRQARFIINESMSCRSYSCKHEAKERAHE